jgi:enamine deaminase RidA (YjgF/YER057c/UK114 family)
MGIIDQRLKDMGVELPAAVAPAANYVPYVRTGNLLFVSGQVCLGPDRKIPDRFKGKLGAEVSNEEGMAAARFCAINVLAQVKAATGDLDKVVRCVRMGGFINSTPNFGPIPQIMNGASDFMVEVFGDNGRHARSTVGVAQLPLDCAVEVEAVFEVC